MINADIYREGCSLEFVIYYPYWMFDSEENGEKSSAS